MADADDQPSENDRVHLPYFSSYAKELQTVSGFVVDTRPVPGGWKAVVDEFDGDRRELQRTERAIIVKTYADGPNQKRIGIADIDKLSVTPPEEMQ